VVGRERVYGWSKLIFVEDRRRYGGSWSGRGRYNKYTGISRPTEILEPGKCGRYQLVWNSNLGRMVEVGQLPEYSPLHANSLCTTKHSNSNNITHQ
jgi:hypothetical protein